MTSPHVAVYNHTPRDAAIAHEESPFGEDYDQRAIDAIGRVLLILAPRDRGKASVVSSGYRVIALAILMRRETRSCEDIAKELGCTRSIISYYVRRMAKELGIQSPDRTAEAIKVYQKRQLNVWKNRLNARHSQKGQKVGKKWAH